MYTSTMCVYAHICVCQYVCVYVYVYVCMCVCVYVCMCVCVCMCACTWKALVVLVAVQPPNYNIRVSNRIHFEQFEFHHSFIEV